METLNSSVLGELQSFMDPGEFIEFIDTAHQKLQQQAPVLHDYIVEQNWGEARRLAHRLKGMLGSLGCEKSYAALHTLEEGLRQSPPRPPQAQERTELEAILQAAQRALKQHAALGRSATACHLRAAESRPRANIQVPQPGAVSHPSE